MESTSENAALKQKSQKIANRILLTIIAIITIIIISALFSHSNEGKSGDGWKVVSTQDYVRDGKQCMGYRIYLEEKPSSYSKYKEIFEEVTNDQYYLHTVWFYLNESEADGSSAAYKTMEQTATNEIPFIRV